MTSKFDCFGPGFLPGFFLGFLKCPTYPTYPNPTYPGYVPGCPNPAGPDRSGTRPGTVPVRSLMCICPMEAVVMTYLLNKRTQTMTISKDSLDGLSVRYLVSHVSRIMISVYYTLELQQYFLPAIENHPAQYTVHLCIMHIEFKLSNGNLNLYFIVVLGIQDWLYRTCICVALVFIQFCCKEELILAFVIQMEKQQQILLTQCRSRF